MMKKLVVFDLDGTLAESKSSIDEEMAGLLNRLLSIMKAAVISGGDWSQFKKQIIDNLPSGTNLKNLSILPTTGAKFYEYKNSWKKLYSENLTKQEKEKVLQSLKEAINKTGTIIAKTWGEQIEDRESQITFSGLGKKAPLEAKSKWDRDVAKRQKMKAVLDTLIPKLSVRLGGTTSIDITKPGIDKAYGIKKLSEILAIDEKEMIFIGDAIFPSGNDYPATKTQATCIHIDTPTETKRVIEAIIACMDDKQLTTYREIEKLMSG
jgi:HAD superfamily hydrolase (TIGR01484 family)